MPDPITIPLALAPAQAPVRPAAAWLIPSADPARCLAEVCAWKVDLSNTKLIPLPHGRTNLHACALLAIPPPGSKVKAGHALPYGWEGSKLLLPVDATLRPALASAEVDSLISTPLAVWHPVLGLIECDSPEGLRAWSLLEAPQLRPEDWNAAQHAEPTLPTLRAIGRRMTELTADPFGGAGDDIGRESLGEIPPVPGEPSRNPVAQAARKIVGGLLQGGASIAGGLEKLGDALRSAFGGGGSSRPHKPGAIREWLEKQSAAFFERLERARAAEINRLMEWLAKDPEMALKFALPLTGQGDHGRGIAPPGARLTRRSTNFQLGGTGGGHAADYWNLQDAQRVALINKYRELANLALAEGRHRRAAYIFAQLLGDITSAAEALRQGRFHAEAAVLYRDRLDNKHMAAKCLAEGGLLLEAAKLLEEIYEWVEAGDLHARLESRPDAHRCYAKAVSEALQKKDTLRAATLLEHKLGDAPMALVMLKGAWPDEPQAIACLTAAFDFYVRHQRPEDAREHMRELRESKHDLGLDPDLCKIVTALSRAYPDAEVKQVARVFATNVASRVLAYKSGVGDRGVLHSLAELRPQDALFLRDSHRFLNPPKPKEQPLLPSKHGGLKKHPNIVLSDGTLQLGERRRLTGLDRAFAASYANGMLAVAGTSAHDGPENGKQILRVVCHAEDAPMPGRAVQWPIDPLLADFMKPYFAMAWVSPNQLWLRHALGGSLATLALPSIAPSGQPMRAGTLDGLPRDTIAVDACETIWVKALREDGSVSCHQADGSLLWTHGTPFHGPILREHRGFAVRRDRIVLALGRSVHVISTSSSAPKHESHDFGQEIDSFSANSPYARPLIAAGLSYGVGVLPLDRAEPILVNDDLSSPMVAFTARGTLLAFSERAALAVQMRGNEAVRVKHLPWHERPVAVTPGPERDQVIVIYSDATWQVVEYACKP
jgi:tetratricopeptide (TPR) repeat protein